MSKATVRNGWLVIDGVKVCKCKDGKLEFFDKDKFRSATRGSQTILVDPNEIIQAIKQNNQNEQAG